MLGEWQYGDNIYVRLWWNGEENLDKMYCVLEVDGTGSMWTNAEAKEVYGKYGTTPWRDLKGTNSKYCNYVYEAYFNEGITGIEQFGAAAMERLEKVYLPNTVKTLGYRAFYSAEALNAIELPEGLEVIGDSAFDGCALFTEITLPNSLTYIGSSAFGIANQMIVQENLVNKVIIPKSVEYIGYGAFWGREGLTICLEGDKKSASDFEEDWNVKNEFEEYLNVTYGYKK